MVGNSTITRVMAADNESIKKLSLKRKIVGYSFLIPFFLSVISFILAVIYVFVIQIIDDWEKYKFIIIPLCILLLIAICFRIGLYILGAKSVVELFELEEK